MAEPSRRSHLRLRHEETEAEGHPVPETKVSSLLPAREISLPFVCVSCADLFNVNTEKEVCLATVT